MSDAGTNPRAPGERPRPGQCVINGIDVRHATDTALLRLLRMSWSANMTDLLRSEAKYRNLV